MKRQLRFAIVTSTGGSVMNALLRNPFFRSQIAFVVSDRPCAAIDKARRHNVPTRVFGNLDKAAFSEYLLSFLTEHRIDYVISFYTKLFVGELLHRYQNRIINLHPSLLPSFKGLDGFGDTLRYGARYIGTTIHYIDEHMDEGKIILQSIYPANARLDRAALRHRIFQQQCKSLLQVVRWLTEGRIKIKKNGQVVVARGRFSDLEYSPNLDFREAIKFAV